MDDEWKGTLVFASVGHESALLSRAVTQAIFPAWRT